MGIAGLLDLLRTSGLWHASVRHGYVYGGLKAAGHLMGQLDLLWSESTLAAVAQVILCLL